MNFNQAGKNALCLGFLVFAQCLLLASGCTDLKPLDGILSLPDTTDGAKWVRTATSGTRGDTGWAESWGLSSDPLSEGLTVRFDFRKQVPPPNVEEVARAFGVAASRTSYASDVSSRGMADGSQWVEYKLPMQGEGGVKRIMQVENGIVTITLSTSMEKINKGDLLDSEKWKRMKDLVKMTSRTNLSEAK